MRICRCGALVVDRCDKCDVDNRSKHAEFYSSWKWRKLSERKRTADPLCESCFNEGKTTPATEVHHIVGVDESESLRLNWDNLMSVCSECHARLDDERRSGKRGVGEK